MRFVMTMLVAVLLGVPGLCGSAGAISLAKHCKLECGAAIDHCVAGGSKKAKCTRKTLKACRKEGLSFCRSFETTTTVSTSTTSTSTTSTSTTTIAGPPPSITSIDPDNGIFNRATPLVTITGTDFQASARVTTAGVTVPIANCDYSGVPTAITCTIPPGGAFGRGSVVVQNPDQQSDTVANAWTYTRVVDAVDFCNVQFPKSRTLGDIAGPVQVNHPFDVFGHVVKIGLTDMSPSPAAGIVGQLGVSPLNPGSADLSPTQSNLWRYVDAMPDQTYDFIGPTDQYVATYTPTAVGSYLYVYRFSLDGGVSFTYCDSDDENDGFDPTGIGGLDVVP